MTVEVCTQVMDDGEVCGHPLDRHQLATGQLHGHDGPWWICLDCEREVLCPTCGNCTMPDRDGTHLEEPRATAA